MQHGSSTDVPVITTVPAFVTSRARSRTYPLPSAAIGQREVDRAVHPSLVKMHLQLQEPPSQAPLIQPFIRGSPTTGTPLSLSTSLVLDLDLVSGGDGGPCSRPPSPDQHRSKPMKLVHLLLLLSSLGIQWLTAALSLSGNGTGNVTYDLVVLGANPGGIMAAVAASRLGTKNILLLDRNDHIGGLPANGLGATDISTKGATGGLFLEFVGRIKTFYEETYGNNSRQVTDSQDGYHFEPKVAELVLTDMLNGEKDAVTVLTQRQFDADPVNLLIEDNRIKEITVTNLPTGEIETYSGSFWIDGTYEGDLIGAAKVPIFLGREGEEVYNEIGAGVVYKYWNGNEENGTTHQGDNAVQAYNYRLCLTQSANNTVPIAQPTVYNREEYTSMIPDIISGCFTGFQAEPFCPDGHAPFPIDLDNQTKPNLPSMPNPAIFRLSSIVELPNSKWDGNNEHLSFISTDLPEENWLYPTSSWYIRDRFAGRLRNYTEGFFYFAQNDPAVPAWFRSELAGWGWCADEYTDNGNFPRQVYVREGRRMKGEYIFTTHDALETNDTAGNLVVHKTSITSSHYALDSHAARKREPNRVHLDGFVSYPVPRPYTVPYGVMVPDSTLENLLGPVPASGSHIGFSTLRTEPAWMGLGQAAGTVIDSLVKNDGTAGNVHSINITEVQMTLLQNGAVLVYFDGVNDLDATEFVSRQWALLQNATWTP